MSPEKDSIVAQHVLRMVPPHLLALYRALETLKYPIIDRRALEMALQEQSGSDGKARLVTLASRGFAACDFALDSAPSAMDKLTERLFPPSGPRLPGIAGLPQSRSLVDPREVLRDPEFGDSLCGEWAEELYHDLRNQGWTVVGAARQARLELGRCNQWWHWFLSYRLAYPWLSQLTTESED